MWPHFEYVLVGGGTAASRHEISVTLRSIRRYHLDDYTFVHQRIKRNYWCEACFLNRPINVQEIPANTDELVMQDLDLREWLTPAMRGLERGYNYDGYREMLCPAIGFNHVPHIDSICTCDGFEAGCNVSAHLVKVESLPSDSTLAGMASYGKVPRQLKSKVVCRGGWQISDPILCSQPARI